MGAQNKTSSLRIYLCLYLFLRIFLVLPFCCSPAPTHTDPKAVEFMQKYGFLKKPPEGVAAYYDSATYSEGIRKLQKFYGLWQSGWLDKETYNLIMDPRCGIPDMEENSLGHRTKRFVKQGSVWSKTDLKYFIGTRTKDLPKDEVDRGLATALKKWSDVSRLTFKRVFSEREADFTIMWATGAHGDVSPFDGPAGSLAHAFYPDAGKDRGNVHVDDDETWTIVKDTTKHNLIQVVTHELGHSFGLKHSGDRDSMMFAYINRHRLKLDLNEDDIAGIQEIYGKPRQAIAPVAPPTEGPPIREVTKRPARKPTINPFVGRQGRKETPTKTSKAYLTTTRPTRPSRRRTSTDNPFYGTRNPFFNQRSNSRYFCESLDSIDAAIKINQSVYLFWKSLYFKTNGGLMPGFPRTTSGDWVGMPDNLDAALHWPADYRNPDKYMFFKGSQILFFNANKQLESVASIQSYFRGRLPNDIDAAFVRNSAQGKLTYFLKGQNYYTTNAHGTSDVRGPYAMSQWGINSKIDAAFTFEPIATYFFVGNGYYASDAYDDSMQVNHQYYPRRTSQWWLSCF